MKTPRYLSGALICACLLATAPPARADADLPAHARNPDLRLGADHKGASLPASPSPEFPPASAAADIRAMSSSDSAPGPIEQVITLCGGDPLALFEFVRDEIRFTPHSGFRKGAELTLLSRSGSDADQADLLVTLLREAGYLVNYYYFRARIPYADAFALFGVDNLDGLSMHVASAGYSAALPADEEVLSIDLVGVAYAENDVIHRMFPAFKLYEEIPGIDLASATGYSRADLLLAAGGLEGDGFASGISAAGIAQYLGDRATALANEVAATLPDADLRQVVGGRRMLAQEAATLDDCFPSLIQATTLGYSFSPLSSALTYIDMYVGTADGAGNLEYWILNEWLRRDQIGARTLSVSFGPQNQARIHLGDELLSEEALPIASGELVMEFNIYHPYATSAFDRRRTVRIRRGAHYTVYFGAGGESQPDLIAHTRKRIDDLRRAGLPDDSPGIVAESLQLLALDWHRQAEAASDLLKRIVGGSEAFHDSITVIHEEGSIGVDISLSSSLRPTDGDMGEYQILSTVPLVLGSALEHGVIEQNYPGLSAVSTVRYVQLNNAAGNKTFFATSGNYAGTIATDPDFVSGWDASYRETRFPQRLASVPDAALVIPQDGNQQTDDLTGNGYFLSSPTLLAASIHTNRQALNGGYATTPQDADPDANPTPGQPTKGPALHDNPTSEDPVDLLTGAALLDHTDLVLGDGVTPRGLAFSRHYSSAASEVTGPLGPGWSHNLAARIIEHSGPMAALGQGAATQAAEAVAGILALSDILRHEDANAKGWVVASLIAAGLVDGLVDNTATLVNARKNHSFTRQPDDAYAPPPGLTARLTRDPVTGAFSLIERFDHTTTFDADGRIASATDADGQTATFTWDADRLTGVTDTYGRAFTLAYYTGGAEDGLLATVTDSTGRSVGFTYADGRLATVTDADGHTRAFTYHADGRLHKSFNKLGQEVAAHDYDARGRVIRQTAEGDPAQEWRFAYGAGRSTEISPLGRATTYHFDERGRKVAVTDAAGHTHRWRYDGQDQVVETIDPKGNATTVAYDGRNNPITVTNARGQATTLAYDGHDRLVGTTDPTGAVTAFEFTPTHHLSKITDPAGRETTFTYHTGGTLEGLLHETVGPNGDTTAVTHYDAFGNPVTIARADGATVTNSFNARGDLLATSLSKPSEPNTYPLTLTHDASRRLLANTDALGFGESRTLDAHGRVVAVTNRHGETASTDITPWGRVSRLTAPSGASTIRTLDADGLAHTTTDPLGQATHLSHDPLKRPATITNPLGHTTAHAYDPAGNASSFTNANGHQWQWQHSPTNRVASLTSPLGRTWSHTYDARDLPESVTRPSGEEVLMDYWPDGQLKSLTDGEGVITFDYDAKGRLHTVTEGAEVITREYDSLDRMVGFTDAAGNDIGYTYDVGNNLTQLVYPDGKTVTYAYDNAGRPTSVTDWAARVTTLGYDSNSRLAEIRLPNGTRRLMTYDAAGRLTGIRDEVTATGETISQFGFEYDLLDRIRKEVVTPEPPPFAVTPATMTYDADDRLATWNGQTCASDADGNLTSGPLGGTIASFDYDARSRLVSAGGATYTYDAEGRRTSQTSGGVTTTYVHDPQAALSRLLTRTTGSQTTRYVYAGGHLLYGETDGGALQVHHSDSRGSTAAITDGNGTVTDRITYGPYGETVSRTGTTATPFLFNGAMGVQTDPNGLLHMRARYYSPETRRFLNADPIGFDGGSNWYAFVEGNPVMGVDPLGLKDYTATETARLLLHARQDAIYGGILKIADNHSGFGLSREAVAKYDFKGSGDTFQVPGRGVMKDSEFGNYIAGFSAGSYGSDSIFYSLKSAAAGTAMVFGGIVYDFFDWGPTLFDDDGSRYFISAGYIDAAYLHHHRWKDFLSGKNTEGQCSQ